MTDAAPNARPDTATADNVNPDDLRPALVAAALAHVPFDGWSDATLRAAAADTGTDLALARALFPRGGVDLVLAWHRQGDRAMEARLQAAGLTGMRYRDRVAFAVRTRIEVAGDREAVRRAAALLALPQHAPDGARALWDTADAIWTALGDTSDDLNWYSKRATLSGVCSATVLYWLGDESEGAAATWAFLDRRIEDVMRIEKAKAAVRENPFLRLAFAGPLWLAGQVRAPQRLPTVPLPGGWAPPGVPSAGDRR